jgi:hypothetical protein
MTDEIELNRKISKLEIKEYMQTEAEWSNSLENISVMVKGYWTEYMAVIMLIDMCKQKNNTQRY